MGLFTVIFWRGGALHLFSYLGLYRNNTTMEYHAANTVNDTPPCHSIGHSTDLSLWNLQLPIMKSFLNPHMKQTLSSAMVAFRNMNYI